MGLEICMTFQTGVPQTSRLALLSWLVGVELLDWLRGV
jgi:hypothetical protein